MGSFIRFFVISLLFNVLFFNLYFIINLFIPGIFIFNFIFSLTFISGILNLTSFLFSSVNLLCCRLSLLIFLLFSFIIVETSYQSYSLGIIPLYLFYSYIIGLIIYLLFFNLFFYFVFIILLTFISDIFSLDGLNSLHEILSCNLFLIYSINYLIISHFFNWIFIINVLYSGFYFLFNSFRIYFLFYYTYYIIIFYYTSHVFNVIIILFIYLLFIIYSYYLMSYVILWLFILLFLVIFIFNLFYWVRDINRELIFSPNIQSVLCANALLWLIFSEACLFTSLFIYLLNISFMQYSMDVIVVLNLSYYGSIILSLISLYGGYLLLLVNTSLYYNNAMYIILFIIYFIIFQFIEYRLLGLILSDNVLSSIIYFILTLHLSHIIFIFILLLIMELYYIPYFYYSFINNLIIGYSNSNYYLFFIFFLFYSGIIFFNFIFIIYFIIITVVIQRRNSVTGLSSRLTSARWIEIATGGIYLWINYHVTYSFNFSMNIGYIFIINYSHFVDILWLCIDYLIYFL